jgi:hypothetical protein
MTTPKQILISRCRILALLATTLETVQTSAATSKGLRVIAEELDLMAVDINRLEPDEEIPLRQVLASFRRRTANPVGRSRSNGRSDFEYDRRDGHRIIDLLPETEVVVATAITSTNLTTRDPVKKPGLFVLGRNSLSKTAMKNLARLDRSGLEI